MRIITGSARGKRLITVPGNDLVRPTSEKAKEALFSSIQFDIEGRRVLDLFAGCGQLGIEALSRGAASAVFVDRSDVSLGVVKKNLEGTPFESDATLVKKDYLSYLASCNDKFDIVFLDPPYASDFLIKALGGVEPFVNKNGTVFCEHPAETVLPETLGKLKAAKVYRFGKIHITTYKSE